eukprot:5084352-Prymnesium_polylepis.1
MPHRLCLSRCAVTQGVAGLRTGGALHDRALCEARHLFGACRAPPFGHRLHHRCAATARGSPPSHHARLSCAHQLALAAPLPRSVRASLSRPPRGVVFPVLGARVREHWARATSCSAEERLRAALCAPWPVGLAWLLGAAIYAPTVDARHVRCAPTGPKSEAVDKLTMLRMAGMN